MSNEFTMSFRRILYFPEGSGSVRLDILVHKYRALQTYKLSYSVYKKGTLLMTYTNAHAFEVLKSLAEWVRDFGTKPEKVKNG